MPLLVCITDRGDVDCLPIRKRRSNQVFDQYFVVLKDPGTSPSQSLWEFETRRQEDRDQVCGMSLAGSAITRR